MCILIENLSHAHTSGEVGGGLNDFKFGTFIGRFSSDSAASRAVKGLRTFPAKDLCLWRHFYWSFFE